MPDIFDQVGDVFDKAAPPSIADQARARLASRGLTPDLVKQGYGVTTPTQVNFAPPQTVNGGFLGGVGRGLASMVDPSSLILNALTAGTGGPILNAYRAMKGMPQKPTATDIGGAALQTVGLPNYPAIAKQASARGAANQSTSDMYGEASVPIAAYLAGRFGPSVIGAAADMPASVRAAAGRASQRGFNRMMEATPQDLANGGVPGRGVAAIQPESSSGFGRIGEIDTALQQAKAAKDNFLANDINANYRTFDPEPLIQQAIDAKQNLATTQPALRRALGDFGTRMRQAVQQVTGGEQRPLSAAEMDKLRGAIEANWYDANKQNMVVPQEDLKLNDAAVDMDRAIRQNLESDQSPIGKQYKALNQRIQDLAGAKTVQQRTNTASLAPQPEPEATNPYVDVKRIGMSALDSATRPMRSPAQNYLYKTLGRIGGLNSPIPQPEVALPPIGAPPSLSGMLGDPMVPGSRRPDFAAGPSGPAYGSIGDVYPDMANARQTFARDANAIPDAQNSVPQVPMRGMPDQPPFDPTLDPSVRHSGNLEEAALRRLDASRGDDYLRMLNLSRQRSAQLIRDYLMSTMPK